jgi:aspartate 1-decarboxylase
MLRSFLKAKIRDIRITGKHLEYEGSITLDENYLEQAGIMPYEEVHVLNLDNGSRFTTYAIKGKKGSGIVELNGPAALLGEVGNRIMVLSFVYLAENEIYNHYPKIISGNN